MPNIEYPFSVYTNEGTLVKGWDTINDAETNAKQRNDRADKMGLKVRYEATNIPAKRGK